MRAWMIRGAVVSALFVAGAMLGSSCSSVDCSDARVGEVRCVGNQVERCTQDNLLTYEGCGEKGLVCSSFHGGCVTSEVAMVTSSTVTTGGGGGMGGGTTTGVGGSGGMGGGGMGGAGGMGGNGGGMLFQPVNGCDPAQAVDMTATPTAEIHFKAFEYTPPCMKIKAGNSVKFVADEADFLVHPLRGGIIVMGQQMPDAMSPIPQTTMGTEATFMFPTPGTYGYYCEAHGPGGMQGAIYVEP